jgi:hypothetical protein
MQTWLSWGLVLAIAGAAYFYYSQKDGRVQTRGRSTVPKTPVQWTDTETKPKSAAKNTKAKKANKAAEKPVKSVKNAVQEVGKNVEAYLSTASTAGADADDDLTPATSPSLGAVQNPSGKNVSDMLEPQAIRQILKIGATDKQARPAKPQQQRSETQEKTKKQRQNEKKKEEAKVAREAAEAERKKLAEQQRRTAREARGEPARNGLQSAQAPTSNAWSRPAAQAAPAAAPVSGQLLDTIDNVSTASSSEAATNGTAPTPDSTSYSNLPSEEDQLRLAMEDSAWTTVPKGKKAKKTKNVDEGSDSGASAEPAPAPVKAAKPAAPVKKAENVKPASRFEVLSPPTIEASHPMDSDWPVV